MPYMFTDACGFIEPTLDVLALSITTSFNLKCDFCSRDAGGRRNYLTPLDITNILNSASSFTNLRLITISGGEPTLHPNFFEIMQAAKGYSQKLSINTNGTTLTSEIIRKMKICGVTSVALSLDSSNSKLHDEIRGVDGAFNKTLSSINLLRKNGIRFTLKTTLGKKNVNELSNLIIFANTLGASKVSVSRTIPIGRAAKNYDFIEWETYSKSLNDGIKIAKELSIDLVIDDPLKIFLNKNSLNKAKDALIAGEYGGCAAGISMAYILPNKDVLPCPAFPYVLGNIEESDFKTIWFSEKANSIRNRDFLKGKCGSCQLKNICGGCRGMAYSLTNDIFANDPFCPKTV